MRIELAECLPAPQAARLETISKLAAELGLPAYLVGGPVRDLLLGYPSEDIDIAVEGEVGPLAERIALFFGGRLISHQRFGTALVQLPDWHVDIARTRREYYPQPGALPVVEPATIAEDLRRRDFSYNAIALRLDREEGEIFDPLGGWQDLQVRRTRALHPRSFVDDPTRILRAARYAARLQAPLEACTELWLREAVAAGALQTVTGQRIWGELSRLLAEKRMPEAVGYLDAWGVLASLGLRAQSLEELQALTEATEVLGAEKRQQVCAALGLLAGTRAAVLAERFGLTAEERQAAIAAAEAGLAPPPALLARELKNSTLYETLRPLPPAAWLALWARHKGTRAALARFLSLSGEIEISGDDLRAEGFAPSPGFAVALAAARRAKLDKGAGREEQLAAAREALREWQSLHDSN